MSVFRRFSFIAIALATFFGATAHASAEGDLPLRVGALVGANYNLLEAPADPAGEPTLLSGAAFSGAGFQGGILLSAPLVRLGHESNLVIEIDLLFGQQTGEGKAESPSTGQLRVVELQAYNLRAPLLARLQWESDGFGFGALFGPELILGMSSGSVVTEENIAGTPQPLTTTPVTHIGLTAGLGARMPVSDNAGVPIEFRFTWDPSVPDSTRDRFDNYQDFDSPGSFQVAFNYQFFLMIGFDYQLSLAGDS